MDYRKRDFLGVLAAAVIAAPVGIFAQATFAQQGTARRPAMPGDNFPDISMQPPSVDPKRIQEHNQKVILEDIQKLYKLAGELKDEVEKTDSKNTLSLTMVQKAKEVEKLAKQIANLAIG
jgi:hypothetical protein